MSETLCPLCNTLNRDTARYCAECGTPLLAEAASPDRQTKPLEPEAPAGASAVGERAQMESERTLVQRYRIESELSRIGFETAYAAWDVQLNRKCVVKENLHTASEISQQFDREAAILVDLVHPSLPRVIDHFEVPDQGLYLVLDFVEGEDLLSRISREGRVASAQALEWGIQLCEALVYLHSQDSPVLHCNLKPTNIRITSGGRAVLVDFGFGGGFNPQSRVAPAAQAVSPGYVPPEQFSQGVSDVCSDVYALGAVLYHLLTGLEPLASSQRMMGQHILPIREISPEVSRELERTIERAMALDPADRFQTSAELLEVLRGSLRAQQEPLLVEHNDVPAVAPTMHIPDAPALKPHTLVAPSDTQPMAYPAAAGNPGAVKKPGWVWLGIGGTVVACLLGLMALGSGFLLLSPPKDRTSTVVKGIGTTPLAFTPGAGKTKTTPLPAFRSKDPETYLHLAYGEPNTLDPSLNYETSGAEIISNLYDSLVSYKKGDPNVFVPQLAMEVPSFENGGIADEGRLYRFRIRSGVQFHNGKPLTPEDVAYTFQRGILQGGAGSPQWLFTEPLLGIGIYDISYLVDPSLIDQPKRLAGADAGKLRAACERVKQAVQVDGEGVSFRLAQPWSPFLATLATSFGSILSKDWVIENGGWDGDCATWQNYYSRTSAEINATLLGLSAMGTGPYKLDKWDLEHEIVLKANQNYWMKQPAWEGAPIGSPMIETVVIRWVEDEKARFAQLRTGEADSIDSESNMVWADLDRLVGMICSFNDQDCRPAENPDAPLELVRGSPSRSRADLFFNWLMNVQGGNEYAGSGSLDGYGVPSDFFANVHVRRAFAFCFNYESYLKNYLSGEGVRTINVMPAGMVGYNPATPYYVYDAKRCEAELRQAEFAGRRVWETGFRLAIPYEAENSQLKTIANILADEFTALNERFQVEARSVVSRDYYAQLYDNRLPFFLGGWSEDIHDPHNWVYPYTVGIYAHQQGMPVELSRQFMDFVSRGVAATNVEQRVTIYQGFNELYYEQAPAILLYSTVNRHYQQRWVNGWYDNPFNLGMYFYSLSKD